MCEKIRPVPVATRLVLIMHQLEEKIWTNTGRLAAHAVAGAEVRYRGTWGQPLDERGIVGPEGDTIILFPREGAAVLDEAFAATLRRPVTLVVPDGNWTQAKKVYTRVPALREVPCVRLPPGPPSVYTLRRAPFAYGLSTMEAVARALGVLDGDAVREELERLLQIFIDRTLWARGAKRPEHCAGGIPAAAIEEQRIAGARHSGRPPPAIAAGGDSA
jgi:DTW domain-containing protein YfiP